MSNYIRLCNNLDSLSLTKIKEYLPAYLDEKVSSKMSTVEILLDLTKFVGSIFIYNSWEYV